MPDEEKQELETLRREKQQHQQNQRAKAALETAGVPVSFASLLTGADDADTDARTAQFCAAYQEALTQDIRQRLPQQPPAVTPPTPRRHKRGAQLIH